MYENGVRCTLTEAAFSLDYSKAGGPLDMQLLDLHRLILHRTAVRHASKHAGTAAQLRKTVGQSLAWDLAGRASITLAYFSCMQKSALQTPEGPGDSLVSGAACAFIIRQRIC